MSTKRVKNSWVIYCVGRCGACVGGGGSGWVMNAKFHSGDSVVLSRTPHIQLSDMSLVLSVLKRTIYSNTRAMSTAATGGGKVMEELMITKLTEAFTPLHLEVVNESYKHSVPKGAESHFKVLVVSDAFEEKKLVERHRMINAVLAEQLQAGAAGAKGAPGGIHALSIQAKTRAQYEVGGVVIQSTPNCAGGGRKA